MAKSMAKINNNNVVNIMWMSDKVLESDFLKEIKDRPVAIGDTYEDGKFYRNGEEVLTPFEKARETIKQYEIMQLELNTAYNEGINSI